MVKTNNSLKKYDGIISVEKEIQKIKESQENEKKQLIEIQTKASDLHIKYKDAKLIYKELERDIKLYQNDLEFVELGIYQPIFDYDTSDKYKKELAKIRANQKDLIKEGNACVCYTQWHVNGNYKKGEVMTRRYINLTLRAFNGECDTLISKVKWNNVQRFAERINKSFRAINRLGKSNNVEITKKYLSLKLDELHLAYELEHKRQEEKEEQKTIRQKQREEERAQREFEKAKKEAEIEENVFKKLWKEHRKNSGLSVEKNLKNLTIK